jgi:hypothetical protein
MTDEKLFPVQEAVDSVMPKKIPACTISRWSTKGLAGVKLETQCIGGRRYCSKEAVMRFVEKNVITDNAILDFMEKRKPRVKWCKPNKKSHGIAFVDMPCEVGVFFFEWRGKDFRSAIEIAMKNYEAERIFFNVLCDLSKDESLNFTDWREKQQVLVDGFFQKHYKPSIGK